MVNGIIGNIISPTFFTSDINGKAELNDRLHPHGMSSAIALRSSNIRNRLRDPKDVGMLQKNNQRKGVRKQYKKNQKVAVRSTKGLPRSSKEKININENDFDILSSNYDDIQPCSSLSLARDKTKEEIDFFAFDKLRKTDSNTSFRVLPFCTPVDASRTNLTLNNTHCQSENRRKFYIVQNGGSPAEMYCTDLVHKAKHGQHSRRNVDESRLMKCTDKWREEWNHGVQMPLSCERPVYCFERVSLFSDVKVDKFELSKKYIALKETRYTKNFVSSFQLQNRPLLYHYEVDSADENWLHSKEGNHISKQDFLDVMDQLEVDCYKNIHIAILEQLTYSRDHAKTDDDADCDICCMPEWEPGDEIVFCDMCNMSVHQSCYGLDAVPTDSWMCATCVHHLRLYGGAKKAMFLPSCIFCPILGGAMKCTKNAELWAHVVCALWIPEVRFGDVERREPITHISDIPADRWKAVCSVCDTCNGACIRCTYAGCNIPFHISCAQRSGLVLQIEQSSSALNGVRMTSYCSKHSFLSPCRTSLLSRRSSNNFADFDRNQLDEMKQNFFKHVDLQKICEDLELSQKLVDDIYTYWHWKRKLNASRPLMIEPLELKFSVQPKQIRSPQQAAKVRQKNNAFNKVPPEELLNSFEKIHQLRLNLEKARNLCYMVSRREKLKRAQLATFEQVTLTMGGLLMDPVIPCSKRRTEKLLEIWESTNKEILTNEEDSEMILNSADSIISSAKSPIKTSDFAKMKDVETLPHPIVQNCQHQRTTKKHKLVSDLCVDLRERQRNGIREISSPLMKNFATNDYVCKNHVKAFVGLEEQKKREDPYVFRSSTSPHLSVENFNKVNGRVLQPTGEGLDNGNVSDASNFTEYSVAWSNPSENDETLFNFENAILPIRLKNGEKNKRLNGKNANSPNGILKVKKVNFKKDRLNKTSGLNGWKNGVSDYVLHHPELREDLKPRKLMRTASKRSC